MGTRLSENRDYPAFVIAGRLRRDYLLPEHERALIDIPGGNLIYAAAGLGVWNGSAPSENRGNSVGLLGRVGEDYPREWLRSFNERGWDTRGIHILTEALDLRYFQTTLPQAGSRTSQDNLMVTRSNPVAHFARLGLPFPKSLLGYQAPAGSDYGPSKDRDTQDRKSAQPASPRPNDIPPDYLNAQAVHICPLDYQTASSLSSNFRQAAVTTLTLDPSTAFMTVNALEDVRILVQGLTAFLPCEEELRALFWGRTNDLWQMAEAVGEFGCEFIIVKRGAHGQMLYDSVSKKKWEIPAYPARVKDALGAGDSFCGGFLAGYQKTYDPLRGVLYGCVSASLTIEGSGVFHPLEALPGLAERRLESLTELVRQI
jgi:sugar/nucleoside kinase (ribokinase family)